jgi:hypothetical protein
MTGDSADGAGARILEHARSARRAEALETGRANVHLAF